MISYLTSLAKMEAELFIETVFKPVIWYFMYSDGHSEKVRTMGRFNLLMKVPDVKLVYDLRFQETHSLNESELATHRH